jgi:hypothetical protein
MKIRQFIILSICLLFASFVHGQSISILSKFDPRLIKYYKVDTCRVYENVSNGQQTVQYLKKAYLFDANGNISQEIEFGQSEFDGHTITKYEYNANNLISRKIVMRVDRDPIEYTYYNVGNKWTSMVTTYPFQKEYTVQTNDQGLVLGILGKAMIPEKDSITDEPTGKEIFGVMEEYEYRYNRHSKISKENYYYQGRIVRTITYQYTPNGYSPPISMSYFKEESTLPETTTTFTYDPTGFLLMEIMKDNVTGYTNTLEYEYAYHYDSPIFDVTPELKENQKFWLGK